MDIDFSDRTTVLGANGTGKTSIYDALLWVLFDKNHNGASAVDIRPHDADGNDIHNTVINVSCTFDIDGREVTLQKNQTEKWTKKRGTDVTTFTGNENTFTVNGIPKSVSEYKKYIEENICDEKTFFLCTNAQAFFSQSTKDKRATLLSLASDVTDERVIATNEEFAPLSSALMDGTVEQLIKRSKDTAKMLDKEREDIPPRIDELNKSLIDTDVAEYELLANSLKEEIARVDEEIASVRVDKGDAEAKMTDIKNRCAEIINSCKEKNEANRKSFMELRRSYSTSVGASSMAVGVAKKSVLTIQSNISDMKRELVETQRDISEAMNLEFDPDSLICPTCGQTYPDKRVAKIKDDFRMNRGDRISDGKLKADKLKKSIETAKEDLTNATERMETAQKNLDELNAKIAEIDKQKPQEVSYQLDEEYIELQKEYTELHNKVTLDVTSVNEKVKELNMKKFGLESQLKSAYTKISAPQRNAEIELRIEGLQNRQREISQLIANEMKMLDLLEKFNRTKMNMLSEEVNKHFKIVKVRLFLPQINGGIQDVCQILVNGSSYETCLNTGHKILADIDILSAFQTIKELDAFLFVDNAEALNDFNVPNVDRQLVLLKVADNKELEVINE